jgi:hypothetical protein
VGVVIHAIYSKWAQKSAIMCIWPSASEWLVPPTAPSVSHPTSFFGTFEASEILYGKFNFFTRYVNGYQIGMNLV